jgi:C-terminal processing protease CtpA/Prc
MYTQDRDGETFQWLTDDVAYLKLSTIADSDVEGYIRQVQDARGLIVDLRSYPKEFVVFALGGHLVTEPMAFAAITEPDLSNPSAFIWLFRPSLQPLAPHYGGKVVALVNEVTQSQAEYTAMALRAAPNVSIVGSTTAGTDGNLSKVTLPGSLDTGLTGLGIFYPDGSPTQRVGIVPDIFVTPSVDGIRSGRDELLERALQEILGDDLDKQAVQEIARSR